MKYRNTSAYVQRKMNNFLRKFRSFCKIYIDDVMIFNRSLNEHLFHLKQMFDLFTIMNIALKSIKIYFNYFNIALLNQKVDSLRLIIFENKLKIIIDLSFFRSLKNLKTYLNIIEWLRNYISYYAQKVKSLQRRKIVLLKIDFTQKMLRARIHQGLTLWSD